MEELNNIQFYQQKDPPKHSTAFIRFALLLRYNSFQICRLLLEQLPLPSSSLLRKLASGGVEAVKVMKMLLDNGSMSEDCALIVDEMYLQRSVQYHSSEYVGADTGGSLKEIGLFFQNIKLIYLRMLLTYRQVILYILENVL